MSRRRVIHNEPRHLRMAGITWSTMFPDVDGLTVARAPARLVGLMSRGT